MTQQIVSSSELATLLGVPVKEVYRYATLGMPKYAKGKYVVSDALSWIIEYNRQEALSNYSPTSSGMSIEDAELRKAVAEAQLKELDLAYAREQVVNVDDVKAEMDRQMGIVRSSLLGSIPRFAPFLVGHKDEAEAREAYEKQLFLLMTEITERIENDIPIDDVEEVEDDLEEGEE